MPIREAVCERVLCPAYNKRQEHYYKRVDDPPQPCDVCGGSTVLVISPCNAIWLKPINEYNVSGHSRHAQNSEGHIAYRTRSSRLANGAPEPCLIRSVQDQREYCHAEGLEMPSDIPSNQQVSDDGMSASGRGLPGQEI
jgi:hypothetical protein